jgi:DNA invertase Pin-like site-specific DNA recombinase
MASGKFVAYLRVSTDRQGKSGLGLEAQRDAVARYLNGGGWKLVAEYVETESGKRNDRPKLKAALSHAKAMGATVVVAKLDRLSRNTRFLLDVIESGADVVFCDLPQIPPGPTGKFLLTQMASVAELERGLISERTKAALAAAKARGVKLGNPNGARALRGRHSGNREAVNAVRLEAQRRADDLAGIIAALQSEGVASAHALARELNARDILTPRGGRWWPATALRLLDRYRARA